MCCIRLFHCSLQYRICSLYQCIINNSLNSFVSTETNVKCCGQSFMCGRQIFDGPCSVPQMFLSFHGPVLWWQHPGSIHLRALPNNFMLTCYISVWLVLASRHWHNHACLRDVSTAGLCFLDWQTCLLLFAHYWSHQGTSFTKCCAVLLDLTVSLETSSLYGSFYGFSWISPRKCLNTASSVWIHNHPVI